MFSFSKFVKSKYRKGLLDSHPEKLLKIHCGTHKPDLRKVASNIKEVQNHRNVVMTATVEKPCFRYLIYGGLAFYIYLWWFALFNQPSRLSTTSLDYSQIPQLNAGLRSGETPYCYVDVHKLGRFYINFSTEVTMQDIEEENMEVEEGGTWSPLGCRSLQRIAIIIPYRERFPHLKLLLKRLHPMLRRQKLEYRIFLIEQIAPSQFNRGMLMNVGYTEALKHGDFSCFIQHDVDLYPLSDRNIYLCDAGARHLSGSIDNTRFHVKYYNYLGGVSALSTDNYAAVNGFSNLYWGWGREDDDFSARAREAGLALTRPPLAVGLFTMARHVKATVGIDTFDLFYSWKCRWKYDGLNSLSSFDYKTKVYNHKLYTNITVDLGTPPDRSSIDESEVVSWYWFLEYFGYLP